MSVLVDTSVWSLALRRRKGVLSSHQSATVLKLSALIEDGLVRLIGPIRQELLSGVREQSMFDDLQNRLRAFPDVRIETEDYESAATVGSRCRARGVAGSPTDFLICAVALRRGWQVFTMDHDFLRYAEVVDLPLFN